MPCGDLAQHCLDSQLALLLCKAYAQTMFPRAKYRKYITRANLQIREIEAKNAVNMIEAVQDLGLCSRV